MVGIKSPFDAQFLLQGDAPLALKERDADKNSFGSTSIKRVGARNTPIPFPQELENFILPSEERIEAAIREVLA